MRYASGLPAKRAADARPPPRPYHHGDLRAALVASALEVIAAEGPARFTLREITRRAGVSHTAPYRHFASKDALLAAIAGEGSTLLRSAIAQALAASDDVRAQFLAAGMAYVRFAMEHPAHFQVMFFSAGVYEGDPASMAARQASMEQLLTFIAGAQRAGVVRKGDARALASSVWAMHHGLACLALAGQLDTAPRALQRTVDAAHGDLLDGLSRPKA